MNPSHSVNGSSLTWRLIRKDADLVRGPILAYLALALVAAFCLSISHTVAFIAGVSLLISTVVIVGAQLVFSLVVYERSNKTLPFLLSLPITPGQFALAKLVSTVGMFLVTWLLILVIAIVTIVNKSTIPMGMIPFTVLILLYLLVGFLFILGVSMVTESEAWTIASMGAVNVSISIVMFIVAGIDSIGQHMDGDVAVWNGTSVGLVGAGLTAAVLIVAITLILQTRKTDFT